MPVEFGSVPLYNDVGNKSSWGTILRSNRSALMVVSSKNATLPARDTSRSGFRWKKEEIYKPFPLKSLWTMSCHVTDDGLIIAAAVKRPSPRHNPPGNSAALAPTPPEAGGGSKTSQFLDGFQVLVAPGGLEKPFVTFVLRRCYISG